MQNSDFRTIIPSLWGFQTSPMVFCIQNSDFSPRIAGLYWLQPSSVVLCIHNSYIMTRINSLSEQVSMGPRLRLLICACKTARLAPELLVSMGPRPHLSFCVCKTTWLASELLVSLGPIPHLWLFPAKQRLQDLNSKSLWVPALLCGFVHSQQRQYDQN